MCGEKNKRNCRSRTYHISIMLTPMNYFPFIKALVNCAGLFLMKNTCGQKPTFISYFYIYYIYFITLQKKKNWETDQKPLQMAQPCGFAGFSKLTKNWPFAHFFWPFYNFLSIQKYKKYSLDRNFWPLPTFSDQKLTTKIQKERAIVRLNLLFFRVIHCFFYYTTQSPPNSI